MTVKTGSKSTSLKKQTTRTADENSVLNETSVIKAVWEEHNDEEYRQDQSHWRGVGRWADDIAWQNIGKRSLRRIDLLSQLFRLNSKIINREMTILEWGPGGGANLFAFRHIAKRYYGIDISKKNLDEAARMIKEEGYTGFVPLLLTDSPDTIPEIDPIDFFLSTAVFQHFPNKSYGQSALEAIRRACKPSAVGFIQIRYENGNPKFKGNYDLKDYEAHHIQANSYAIDEFWNLASNSGFEPLFVQEINSSNNYATFYLKVR